MSLLDTAIARLKALLVEYRRSLAANGGGIWREPEAVLRDIEDMPAELEDATFWAGVLADGDDGTAGEHAQ